MPNLPDLFDLSGRVAVVTGAAGLLGAEFCRTLAQAGARLVIADLDPRQIPRTGRRAQTGRLQATSVPTDVADEKSVHHMVQATLDAYGRLDILVNSAALDPKFDPGHQGVREVENKSSTSQPAL